MIPALILAGGQATRLNGADKAFIRLHDTPLVEIVLHRLAAQARHVAISANGDLTRFSAYNRPVLPDAPEHIGLGPLAGVAAGLGWAQSLGAQFLATIPVDTPGIPKNVVARLTPGPSVALYGGRQHHLVAVWPVAFLPGLRKFLEAPGKHKVRDALTLCAARRVVFDTPNDPFLNINTMDDLRDA